MKIVELFSAADEAAAHFP